MAGAATPGAVSASVRSPFESGAVSPRNPHSWHTRCWGHISSKNEPLTGETESPFMAHALLLRARPAGFWSRSKFPGFPTRSGGSARFMGERMLGILCPFRAFSGEFHFCVNGLLILYLVFAITTGARYGGKPSVKESPIEWRRPRPSGGGLRRDRALRSGRGVARKRGFEGAGRQVRPAWNAARRRTRHFARNGCGKVLHLGA